LWIFQAGTALTLSTADASRISSVRLGVDIVAGDRPQHVVQPHQWQAAQAGEGWCLVACVVAPAFRFEGFELAPVGWTPV
jgi:predicted cupin superfamily sugar epimerase